MLTNDGPGTKSDEQDEEFENSGQAHDRDIENIYGTEGAEVEKPEEHKEE